MLLSSAFSQPEPSNDRPLDFFRENQSVVSKLGRDACLGLETGISRFRPDDSPSDRGLLLYLSLKQVLGNSLLGDGFRRDKKLNHFRLVAPRSFSPFPTEICFTRGSISGDIALFNRKGIMFGEFLSGNGNFVSQGAFEFDMPLSSIQSRLLLLIDVHLDLISNQGYSGVIYLVDGEFASDSGEILQIRDQMTVCQFPDHGDFLSGYYESPVLD